MFIFFHLYIIKVCLIIFWLFFTLGDERDMQLIALEQLCMLLLMSDNVDRCFESCPPRTFLPALCRIFLDEVKFKFLFKLNLICCFRQIVAMRKKIVLPALTSCNLCQIMGRSQTTLTRFWLFDHLPSSSCKRSLWTTLRSTSS